MHCLSTPVRRHRLHRSLRANCLERAERGREVNDSSMFTQPSVSAHSLIDRSHGLSFFSLVVNMSGKDVTLSLLDKVVILNRLKNGEKTDKILNEKRSFYALCSESSKTKPRSVKMPHLCHPHERENEQVDIKTLMQLWRKCLLPRGHSRRTIMTFLLKCRDRINVVFFAGQTCDT